MRKIDVLSGGDPLPNYLTYHLIRYALHTTYHVTSVQYIYIDTVVYSMSDHVTVLFPHIPTANQRPVFRIT